MDKKVDSSKVGSFMIIILLIKRIVIRENTIQRILLALKSLVQQSFLLQQSSGPLLDEFSDVVLV